MTPPHYTEQRFETHIESHLLDSGYIKKKPSDYDKDLCLIPSEVIQFIKSSQPKEYLKIKKQYGAATDDKLCYNLARVIPILQISHLVPLGQLEFDLATQSP